MSGEPLDDDDTLSALRCMAYWLASDLRLGRALRERSELKRVMLLYLQGTLSGRVVESV